MPLSTQRKPKQIGLTALIDAVFILLLFFMLSSTFTKKTSIELSSTHAVNETEKNEAKPQLIILNQHDQVSLFKDRNNRMTIEQLVNELDQSKTTILIPEKTVDVQSIISTLNYIKSNGFEKANLGRPIK